MSLCGFWVFVFFFLDIVHKITKHSLNIHEFITKARKVQKLLVKEEIRHDKLLLFKEAQRTE